MLHGTPWHGMAGTTQQLHEQIEEWKINRNRANITTTTIAAIAAAAAAASQQMARIARYVSDQ